MRYAGAVARLVGGLAVAGGISFVAAGPALAAPYPPQIAGLTVSTTTVTVGGTLTISGSGYAAGSSGSVTLHTTPVSLGSFTTNSSGSFSESVTIPSSTPPGTHTIDAVGVAPNGAQLTETSTITVTGVVTATTVPVTVPVTVPTTTSPSLAFTGADIGAMVGVGALLLIGGGAILIGRHRLDGARH